MPPRNASGASGSIGKPAGAPETLLSEYGSHPEIKISETGYPWVETVRAHPENLIGKSIGLTRCVVNMF